jgi:hypothetical protein
MFGYVLADCILRLFSACLFPPSSLAHSMELHLEANLLYPNQSPQRLHCPKSLGNRTSFAFSRFFSTAQGGVVVPFSK